MPSLLTLQRVTKAFHLRPVLRDVSLSLRAGEKVFLAGRNGTGKTTLLKIMAGVMRPESGSGELAGRSMFSPDGRWRSSMAYLGHHPNMYPSFSARENVQLALRIRGQHWQEQPFLEALDRYGLAGRENDAVGTYSEGMLRRLGLIRMTLSAWSLALLDEPASALDIAGTDLLSEAINHWQQEGRTILFTSHDITWGAALADRCLLLAQGVIGRELDQPLEQQVADLLQEDAL